MLAGSGVMYLSKIFSHSATPYPANLTEFTSNISRCTRCAVLIKSVSCTQLSRHIQVYSSWCQCVNALCHNSLVVAAGVKVATLQEAHDLLEQILNSHLAPLAFGPALLLTGQMSTFTSTIAGQVVMSGFLEVSSSPLSRRLSTRALAVLPALYVQINYGTEGTYKCAITSWSEDA